MRWLCWQLLVTLALPAMLTSSAIAAEYRVEVEQGGVARWGGQGVESCGMDGRVWSAVGGACYYPVDFERSPDHVEIARWTAEGGLTSGWLVVVEKAFDAQDIEFPDDHFVHLSQEDLGRHHREQAQVKPLFRQRGGSARFALPLANPAASLPAGGGFGAPRTFNGEKKSPHTGTDYAIPLGTPVLAAADGSVVLVDEHFFSGRSVYVNHGDGLVSMYFHLSEFSVEVGEDVERGQTVGKVGSTGRSTGPHLHLGVRWHRARVDPAWLLGSVEALPQVSESD